MWESMSDAIGDGADALKKNANLVVSDLSGKLHPNMTSIKQNASWICEQVGSSPAPLLNPTPLFHYTHA